MQILSGNCLQILPTLSANSIDAIVTDPPYHLAATHKRWAKDGGAGRIVPEGTVYHRQQRGFMSKTWDGGDIAFRTEVWSECLRVLKPGGYMAAFGSSRTHHRVWCAIEDAGFEIRDTIMYLYGSGFPKSLNVGKSIDKHLKVEREILGINPNNRDRTGAPIGWGLGFAKLTAPATPEGARWDGFGTSLKPAMEPICLARKPLDGTVAANTLKWGTGGLNIDACRIPTSDPLGGSNEVPDMVGNFRIEGWRRPWMDDPQHREAHAAKVRENVARAEALGRWPANVTHDGSEEVMETLPKSGSGSAARYFYCAKASKKDRAGSKHPTIKPVKLVEWLCTLICPPGGTILDPFAGSGTTGEAARNRGFDVILIEREAEYVADCERRLTITVP